MRHDELAVNIESILDCPNLEVEIVQRLATNNQEFRSRAAASIDAYLEQDKKCLQQSEADVELITQLYNVKKETAEKLDSINLAQKVLIKKLDIAMKQQAKLREEIHEAKTRKENISLEMVDIDQELKDGKKLRKDKWTSIKKACSVYKENLNFHIEYVPMKDHDRVKVTFFLHKNPDRNNYYVNLLHYINCWKVGQTEPALKEMHLEELKSIVDITKPLNAQDVIVYLCKLRKLFLKHYFK